MVKKAEVTVKTGSKADVETFKEINPDVVIVAAGAKHNIPDIHGINRSNVMTGK